MSSFFISIDVISGTLGPLIFAVNVRSPYFISLGAAFLVVFIQLGLREILPITILIFPFAAVLFAFSRNIGLTAVLLGVYYSTWSFSEVIVESYISHNVPDSKRATILSISSMFISFFALLSLPVLGSVVDKISLQNSLILLAAEFVVLGLILFSQYQGKNNQNKLNSV